MVSSDFVDALNNPTKAINDLYDLTKPTDTFPKSVSNHFSSIFQSREAFEEIPVLNVKKPPESHTLRSLVRFRAMVQDTSASPEMYLSKLKGDKCGGWGITDEEYTDSDYSYDDLKECTVVWAVSVPGGNEWCSEDGGSESEKRHQASQPLKYPIPNAPHIGVQIKVYDTDAEDTLKSTDLMTFVGILSSEPVHSELDRDSPLEVPTLHVLFSRPLDTYTSSTYPATDLEVPASQIREELITWIADEALGGDKDAAEWVLLAATARVQSRNPPILPPPIALTHFPSPSSITITPTLAHILSQLVPFFVTLPLSLSLLNTSNFTPESKNENLHSGYLQLPAGCMLLITESGVSEGRLVERGLMNLKVLQDVMTSQSLPYVFPFSQFSFPTDLGFIILAEGRKSAFFQADISYPLQLQPENQNSNFYRPTSEITLPSPSKLAQYRKLVSLSKVGKIQVGEAASERIQNDFVRERQDDTSVTPGDLIMRMTIAKFMALSLHANEVTIDIWERAKALDGRRKARTT